MNMGKKATLAGMLVLASAVTAMAQSATERGRRDFWPFLTERRRLPTRRPAGPPLVERAGRRRPRIHRALEGQVGLRPRRWDSRAVLGREHLRAARQGPRRPGPSRKVPRQARRQPGPPARLPGMHAKNTRLTDADPKTIDAAWKLVAAMKKEGIYTRSARTGGRA